MSASAVPIPLDQFALALTTLEVPQLHEENARLQNSLYHLDRSNETLAEYPDDEDCKDAIRYNIEVIDQQKQRVELIRLELQRRGVNIRHMGLNTTAATDAAGAATQQASGESNSTNSAQTPANGSSAGTNGHAANDDPGVYL